MGTGFKKDGKFRPTGKKNGITRTAHFTGTENPSKCPHCKSTNVTDSRFVVLDEPQDHSVSDRPTDKRRKGSHYYCGTCGNLFR